MALEGSHDLGRNESRPARLLDVRDYCKLHIVAHYPAVLLGASETGPPFHVVPVGKIGADEAGRRLREEMRAVGMDVRFVDTVEDRPTLMSVCFQYPDGSGGNLTTSNSAAAALTCADVDRAASLLDERTIALAAPEVPLAVRQHLLKLAGPHHALRVLALASAEATEARTRDLFRDADLVAMNEDEGRALTGVALDPGHPSPFLDACADVVAHDKPDTRVVVTAGGAGVFGFDRGRWEHVPALPVPVSSTAGAGDALLGGLLAALAAGVPFTVDGPPRRHLDERPLESALDFGVLLAALKVTSPHTIHPEARIESLLAFGRKHGVRMGDSLLRHLPGDRHDPA
jgi:sugar/nucleoside kinase (ribokinase family)